MSHALYPGTFDPITYGHIRIIERIAPHFEKVTIGISCGKTKKPMFTADERTKMIRQVITDYPNLEIITYGMLTVEFARKINAQVIIRGLRAVTDYVSEVQMAIMNRSIAPDIETMFLVAEEGYSFVSSSLIKEIVWHGGPIDHLVPKVVADILKDRIESLKKEFEINP
jgi:pantetheine-phosphate adenylyltransferase